MGIKAPVFSMGKLIGVDWRLGPEMTSTGEVMGIDVEFSTALSKALLAANIRLQKGMGILLSIADQDKAESLSLVRELHDAGCQLFATEGTAAMISAMGIPVIMATKRLDEGHPTAWTSSNRKWSARSSTPYRATLRCCATGFTFDGPRWERQIPCFTALDTARAAVESLLTEGGRYNVRPMVDYLSAT